MATNDWITAAIAHLDSILLKLCGDGDYPRRVEANVLEVVQAALMTLTELDARLAELERYSHDHGDSR